MRVNRNLDLSKLYESLPGGKFNKFIVLNEYLKESSNGKIDLNISILEYSKFYQFEELYQSYYNTRKLNAPNWTIALTNWIEEIDNSLHNYHPDYATYCNTIIYAIYNDVTSGINNPMHYYVDYLTSVHYTNIEPLLFEGETYYNIKEGVFECLIDAVIYAFYFDKLNIELKEIQESKAQIVTITKPNEENYEKQSISIEPIVWTGENVLLGYLIQWLKDNGLIAKKTGRDSAIEKHFVDSTGKPIKNIKQALANMKSYNNGQLPRDFEKIQPLLNTLKDLL